MTKLPAPIVARTLTAITIALTAASPALAATQDVLPERGDEISKFREAGAWKVRRNETRETCFASYKSEQGAIVQFGFTEDETVGYLGLFSQEAPDVGSDEGIAVLVNGNLYVGETQGVGVSIEDGYDGGYMLVNNPEFVSDIEVGEELVAFPDTPSAYVVDMSGAGDAVYEVRECTRKLKVK